MARRFVRASSQRISGSSTLLQNEPIDFVAHFFTTQTNDYQVAICLGNNGAAGSYELAAAMHVAGDPVAGQKWSDGGASDRADKAGVSINTWYVGAASFITNTSRAAYLDGSKATNTTSIADPTPDFLTIGARRINAIAEAFDGDIAEAYMLDYNQSDSQHAARGKGYSALWDVPIKNVRGWYPLLRDDNNRMANGYPDLTPTGSPTFTSHPPKVIHPRIGALITL